MTTPPASFTTGTSPLQLDLRVALRMSAALLRDGNQEQRRKPEPEFASLMLQAAQRLDECDALYAALRMRRDLEEADLDQADSRWKQLRRMEMAALALASRERGA